MPRKFPKFRMPKFESEKAKPRKVEPEKKRPPTLSERIQRHAMEASRAQEFLLIDSLLRANYKFLMGEEYSGDPKKLPVVMEKLLSPTRYKALAAKGMILASSVRAPGHRYDWMPRYPYSKIEPFLAQAFREKLLEGRYEA